MTAIFDAISEPIARRVTAGLAKIGLVLRSRAWKGAGYAGVTPSQAHALALLRDSKDGLRPGSLAHLLGVAAPTATQMVQTLVAKGLVAREPGPDRRSITLRLTPDGRLVAERADDWPAFLAHAVETLAHEEQAAFLRSLVKIVRALQEAGDIPVQRMCVTCRHFRPHAHPDPLAPHHCAYVDAPFGDRHLRLNCAEQEDAPSEQREANWERFSRPRGMVA